jgi:VWFA-related protein
MRRLRPVLLAVLAATTVSAQTPPQPPFKSDTSAVMVDVVVRDKKGNPVTDLTAADFQLFEDGVRQRLGQVTLVAPSSPAAAAQRPSLTAQTTSDVITARHSPAAESVNQSVAAIVFERLSPESRAPATRAALRYVDQAAGAPEDYSGVFLLDLSLHVLQTFTTDRSALTSSIEAVASRATAYAEANRIGLGTGAMQATIGAESRGPRSLWPRDMQARVLDDVAATAQDRGYDTIQQTGASLAALKGLVLALGGLAGRKSVVYFSDGLSLYAPGVPGGGDELRAKFEDLIHLANRLNVTFYPVDAVGLRVHSQDVLNGEALLQAVLSDMDVADSPAGGGGGAALGLSEGIARSGSTTLVFGRLAHDTGGFTIEGTNDLERGLARIADDRRFHYLLTYSPLNQSFGGEYRRISVKVVRPGTTVRARSGYLAERSVSVPVQPRYERSAIAALEVRPLPRQIPMKASALGLLSRRGEPRVAVLLAADANAVTFRANPESDTYYTDFTMFARIRDAQRVVVRKASEPYRLAVPIAALDRAQRGEILFFRQPELPPGSYMLEAAVHDALTNAAGARFVPFTVDAPGPQGLLVSSLMLVGRSERAGDATADDSNPLLTGDVLLYPRFGEPYRKDADTTISIFFRMKVPAGVSTPTASLVLLKGNQQLASVPLLLAAPDASGVLDHTAQLPLDALPAGDLVLRLVVRTDAGDVSRDAPIRVE